jgi:hypothetical protein
MSDRILVIVFLLVAAIQFIIIWMRIQMEKRGHHYPFFNASTKVYREFMDLKYKDQKLAARWKRMLVVVVIAIISLTFLTLIF